MHKPVASRAGLRPRLVDVVRSEADMHPTAAKVEVLDVESQHLAAAQTSFLEQQEEHAVTEASGVILWSARHVDAGGEGLEVVLCDGLRPTAWFLELEGHTLDRVCLRTGARMDEQVTFP